MQGPDTRQDAPVLQAAGTAVVAAQRFEEDSEGARAAAWLRLGAAVLSLAASVWLLAVADALVPRIVAGLGLVFGLAWARSQLRRLRAPSTTRGYLQLDTRELVLCDARGALRRVSLADVQRVELDDDRLEIVLLLRSGAALRIDAAYRGLGLRELARVVHEAVAAAARPDAPE